MVISFTKLLRETQQFYVFLWRQHVKKRSSNPCWLRERRGEVSAGNFKLGVHRVLDVEVIELSIWYRQLAVFQFFCLPYFSLFFIRSIRDWRSVRVYCHRTDWTCPINHNNYTMWSLLRRELYMSILLTSAENEHISLFGLLEEWSREFWFIGGRYTWILVYWRKVHVNFGLLEEGTREYRFIGGGDTRILVYWRKVHVNFGLLEEGTREFWFIGGRCMWILVYWRKVHVNFVLLEESTHEFWFITGRDRWILVYCRKGQVNFGCLEEGSREF